MNKKDIIAFFDKLAPAWHEKQERNEAVISFILEKGGIAENTDVLDVASGTGILFGDYLERGVNSLTGIDISPEMVKKAKEHFPWAEVICGDAESYSFTQKFDAIMIYNAFPHFINPCMLFENLSGALRTGGRITVAHGISAAEVEKCHQAGAQNVSATLPCKEALGKIMSACFDVDIMISDERMYMVSGTLKKS